MVNTSGTALARANAITKGYGGMCLAFVQACYNAQARYGSAIAAWNASTHKHATASTSSIPVGAPIFFSPHGSPYGHVAIYAGNGRMRTTNSATGRIHTDKVATWQSWGYKLLGWTSDIENQTIPNLEKSSTMAISAADAKKIAKEVWNYGINDQKNIKHERAETKLSWGHHNTDLLRALFTKDKKGFSKVGDAIAAHPYGDGKGNLKPLWQRLHDLETENQANAAKLDQILKALSK